MRPDDRFLNLPKDFWANVRTISQELGYTDRSTSTVKVHTVAEMLVAMKALGLSEKHLVVAGKPTILATTLEAYFRYRAETLNDYVRVRLMDAAAAKDIYEGLFAKLKPKCPLPQNKQKGAMAAPAYLTCIVNMLVESGLAGESVNYDPKHLTTVTHDGIPLRTFSRRLDGAFPTTVDPIAIWEIKEYYYTTTFGSRIADGVFETQLDGLELEELKASTGRKIEHLLVVDAYYTWWVCGRSYLCRILDMLHMGLVNEVLFGREVIEQLPSIVDRWKAALESHH